MLLELRSIWFRGRRAGLQVLGVLRMKIESAMARMSEGGNI